MQCRCQRLAVVHGLVVAQSVVLHVVTSLVAKSVAAVLVLVVVCAVLSVDGMAVLVDVAAVVVAAGGVLGLDLCLRLLREGSRAVAGTVSFVRAVSCRILLPLFWPLPWPRGGAYPRW